MSASSSISSTAPAATILLEADLEAPLSVQLPCGVAVVLTQSHPLRESPNQDAAAVLPAGPAECLLVVADGMGGTSRGGLAAGTLVSQLSDRLPIASPDQLVRTAILDGIEATNQLLLENIPDAGTTLAAVEINEHTVRPYHVGDSVILVIGQRGKLKFQTVSHSPVGLAVEAGLLTEDEALHHDERHLILNAVGCQDMRIELGPPMNLARWDTVLLASDGLTDNLTLDEITSGIRSGPLTRGVSRLAALTRERMLAAGPESPSKPDDLTIIAYRRSR